MTSTAATIYILYIFLTIADSLKCWKCIGSDCSRDPETLHQAVVVKCNKGESCMKVHYAMAEVNTSLIYDSVTRTCSSEKCIPTCSKTFNSCLKMSRGYHVMGCTMKYCCKDKDLCNSSRRTNTIWTTLSLLVFSHICILSVNLF